MRRPVAAKQRQRSGPVGREKVSREVDTIGSFALRHSPT